MKDYTHTEEAYYNMVLAKLGKFSLAGSWYDIDNKKFIKTSKALQTKVKVLAKELKGA